MAKYFRALAGTLTRNVSKLFSKVLKKKQLCPICGNVNPSKSVFCDFCGSPLVIAVRPLVETKVPDLVVGYVSDVGPSKKSEDNLVVLEASSMYGLKPNNRILSVMVRGIEKFIQAKDIAKKLAPHLLLKEAKDTDFYNLLSEFQLEAYNTISSKIGTAPETWAKIGLLISIIDGRQLIVSNIGKIRAYILGKERFNQISGFIPETELRAKAVKLHKEMLNEGDHVLMCYDGLADKVGEKEIQRIALEAENPQKACDELVRTAKEKGMASGFSIVVACVI